jgi:hypothetical protein
MSRRLLTSAILALLAPTVLGAQNAPAREVRGDTLISRADPAATFVFPAPFRFAGTQTIDILKVAGADQFFFIEAAEDSSIRRLYWVQFEHYYPANDHTYDFSSMNLQPVPFGRLEFLGDVRVRDNYFTMDKRPGSDSQAAQTFLQAKGFRIDGTFATLRLFHLPDASRRRELMIIYGERVPAGTAAADIAPDLTARARAGFAQP